MADETKPKPAAPKARKTPAAPAKGATSKASFLAMPLLPKHDVVVLAIVQAIVVVPRDKP